MGSRERARVTQAPVEVLLFDLGGVLIDIDFDRVLARWAELGGVPFEHVKTRFAHGTAYQQHERGEIDAATYFQALRNELGIDLADPEFEEGWQRVFGGVVEATIALLPRLARAIPLHLFSNTNRAHHEYWKRHYSDPLRPIDRHFISYEMGVRKPEPESFRQVARDLGVPLGRILFFDDTMANVDGARAVGVQAVQVRSPEDVRSAVDKWL
jgi:FMN phosphatase YigB (HAD superfamily)